MSLEIQSVPSHTRIITAEGNNIVAIIDSPTYNCQLCSIGGINSLLENDGSLQLTLENCAKPLVLIDINDFVEESFLRHLTTIKIRGRNIKVKNKFHYESSNSSSMVLILLKIEIA